jgi:hypothetical protein
MTGFIVLGFYLLFLATAAYLSSRFYKQPDKYHVPSKIEADSRRGKPWMYA